MSAFFIGAKSEQASAEPWFGSRFARNCAGCHAPQRLNRPAKDRRCALSCQGCHVNPNGGGLRNFYGKWTEERWLKSFNVSALDNEKSYAPFKKQHYGKLPLEKVKKKKRAKIAKNGYPLVENNLTVMNEDLYWQPKDAYKEVPTLEEFKYRIPQGDPYRQRRTQKFIAGMDARQLMVSRTTKSEDPEVEEQKAWVNFLMAVDWAVSFHPVKEHVSVVYEGRMAGAPVGPASNRENILSDSKTRSLYAMVDDLPYNIFAMYGYYRPLFGNYTPDHKALAQKMFAYTVSNGKRQSQDLVFNALSVGTAPNVPYLNIHLVDRQMALPDDKTKGFAINAGLRGVSYGQSLNYSYWRTTNENNSNRTISEAHSLNMMVMVAKNVISYEGVAFAKDDTGEDFRRGGVHTLELFAPIWRENYFTLSIADANVTSTLLPGKAAQYKVGVRSFLLPGIDLSLTLEQGTEKPEDGFKTTTDSMQGQIHVYM